MSRRQKLQFAHPWLLTVALLVPAVLQTGCGGLMEQTSRGTNQAQEAATRGDWDTAARLYREAQAATSNQAERDAIQPKLDEATARAIGVHVEAGHRAFSAHDLAKAEAEYEQAAALRADDPRVVAGHAATVDVRTRGAQSLTRAKNRYQKLQAQTPTLAMRSEWTALIKDLEWLSQWPRDFPEGATLWRDARSPVATFLLLEAQELANQGKPLEAEARVQKALAWAPGQPDAVALMEKLRGNNDVQARLTEAEANLEAGKAELALAGFQALAKLPNAPPEVATGLREAKKRMVADLLLRAKDHVGLKNWPMAMTLAARARDLATDDKGLTAEAERVFGLSHEKALAGLRKPMQLAEKKKFPGAALVYAYMILTIAPNDKEARKIKAKYATAIAAEASTRLEIVTGGTETSGSTARKHKKMQEETPSGIAQLPQALVAGVRRGLAKAGLENAGIQVVAAGAALKGKKGAAGKGASAKLVLTVSDDKLERADTAEVRNKKFLDRVEIIDNPAWEEAQTKQATALLALNVAMEELRPVQEGLNGADRELYNLEQQLAEIKKKIAEDDAAYYQAHPPTPCADGTLNCAQTRANLRWAANLQYYEKQVQKQKAHLTELGPKRLQLQAVVDERQRLYDQAQKVAVETPRKVQHEVWLPYEYQVRKLTYAARAALEATLEMPQTNVVTVKGKKFGGVQKPSAFTITKWAQQGEDYATGVIEVKNQVLEANHPSALPSDATVVNQLADHLLEPVVPQVIEALGGHGQRFVNAAAQAKENFAKIQQLALAWLTAPGLPVEVRERVRSQFSALTAWAPPPGKLDGGTFLYDKLNLK